VYLTVEITCDEAEPRSFTLNHDELNDVAFELSAEYPQNLWPLENADDDNDLRYA